MLPFKDAILAGLVGLLMASAVIGLTVGAVYLGMK